MPHANTKSLLLFRAGGRRLALDLAHVIEIMRPLEIEEVANTPEFLSGVSIIRGAPAPVVSVAALLAAPESAPARFVLVRAGERHVALAVDEVFGVIDRSAAVLRDLPPLAQVSPAAFDALGALDARLLFVLNSASIVPEDLWERIAAETHDRIARMD
jgi:purine-binding chemotaxis protein CheW